MKLATLAQTSWLSALLLRATPLLALMWMNVHGADVSGTTDTLPSDATAAWAEVEKVHMALRPPADWQNKPPTAEEKTAFQNQLRTTALSFAGKAREFVRRFPTNENVGD